MTSQAEDARGRLPVGKVLALAVVAYLATGLYSVGTNEVAIVRRFGRALARPRGPGLHFGLPYGLDRVTKLRPRETKRVGVAMTLAERAIGRKVLPKQAECLTGDRNLIVLTAVVQYGVKDPRRYLFEATDVGKLVADTAAASLAALISGMTVDDVLTVKRSVIQDEASRRAQATLDRYGLGVRVVGISLEGLSPPEEVAEAFRDVIAARGDRERKINDAQGYAERLLPRAKGEAQRILTDAVAYSQELLERATGEAERFTKMQAQLGHHRQLTARRLIIETMEEVLPRLKKVVLDGERLDFGLFETQE